jgi:uncharacterized protein (DUF433 family)
MDLLKINKEHRMNTAVTIKSSKRSGKPCIRNLRITVYDVLNMLANGMSYDEILEDFPKLTKEDILAALAYAADREHKTLTAKLSA